MKDFAVLRMLDRFKGSFERTGADYDVMRRILQIKLTMDGRRVPTLFNQTGKGKKKDAADQPSGNQFMRSLWLYGLMSIIMVPFIVMGDGYMFQMSIVLGIFMFMITTSMISDFSSVLLDIRDKPILFTRPVSRKTIGMAKMVHVMIYLFFLTLSLTAAPLLAGLIRHGIGFFVIFLCSIVLVNCLVVVLTALLYFLVLHFFDGEKLKDMINYVQIVLSVGVMLAYQLIGRSFDLMSFGTSFEPQWWQLFVVPIWFAAPFELFLHGYGTSGGYYLIFALLAVTVPIGSLLVYIKLMPAFEGNLQKLANNSGRTRKERRALAEVLSRLVCSREEAAFFRFAMNMMRTERDFKLKVYPSLGFALIMPFIFIFNALRGSSLQSVMEGKWYIAIYLCGLMIPTVLMMMRYSGKYKGAWIYRTIPIPSLKPVFAGTVKALLVKLLFPVFILGCILFTALFGFRILPDLLVVMFVLLLYTLICFKTLRKALPFSEPFDSAQQKDGLITFALLLLLFAFAGLHFALTFVKAGIGIELALVAAAVPLLWGKVFAVPWKKIEDA